MVDLFGFKLNAKQNRKLLLLQLVCANHQSAELILETFDSIDSIAM
jgi:hypothetical protein